MLGAPAADDKGRFAPSRSAARRPRVRARGRSVVRAAGGEPHRPEQRIPCLARPPARVAMAGCPRRSGRRRSWASLAEGVVYRVEQDSPRRVVASMIINPAAASPARTRPDRPAVGGRRSCAGLAVRGLPRDARHHGGAEQRDRVGHRRAGEGGRQRHAQSPEGARPDHDVPACVVAGGVAGGYKGCNPPTPTQTPTPTPPPTDVLIGGVGADALAGGACALPKGSNWQVTTASRPLRCREAPPRLH